MDYFTMALIGLVCGFIYILFKMSDELSRSRLIIDDLDDDRDRWWDRALLSEQKWNESDDRAAAGFVKME